MWKTLCQDLLLLTKRCVIYSVICVKIDITKQMNNVVVKIDFVVAYIY